MSLDVQHPLVLVLLALAVLPWVRSVARPLSYPWLAPVPPDPWSRATAVLLRALSSAAIVALVLGLAGLQRPDVAVERVGRGAEIVLLLDRSRSMDQPFADAVRTNIFQGSDRPKRRIAREVLAAFAAGRGQDLFGMAVFSTHPMPVLDLTRHQAIVQAAIEASDVGRGLAETDVGRALLETLRYFEERAYAGSRIILLVSDGGAHIDPFTREMIAELMKRHRVTLYWIYIRSFRSPGLGLDGAELAETVPEHFLHKFFLNMGTPYRAYEAGNPEHLQRAIEDVSRLENLPLTYSEILPAEDLAPRCYLAALVLVVALAALRSLEVAQWR
jgi:mxaC protein